MKKFLALCVEIEELIARTYRQMARSSQLPAELRQMLQKLAEDEDQHAMQLRFAMRFPADTAVTGSALEPTHAQTLLARARNCLQTVTEREVDTRQAIKYALELEEDFCQAHIGNSMTFSNDSLKRMFAALAKDDKTHVKQLLAAKEQWS